METAVPTVTGPVAPDRLGRTLMHEHVFVLNAELERNDPSSFDAAARIPDAVAKLTELREAGFATIVDLTVFGLGRDVARVAEVAAGAGINVVAATGWYTFTDLPNWVAFRGPGTMQGGDDPLETHFVRDIEHGIGETGIRAGVLKCATDKPGVTPGVERVLRAVAAAHRRTGVPISTHADAATRRGLEQQKIFAEEGVDLSRVVIGHSGDSTDLDYLRALADQGSTLGMDRFGLESLGGFTDRVETVARMCELGYADRMVLSHDASCFSHNFDPDFKARRLPDWRYTHIPQDVLPALRERGVTDAQLTAMLVDTPRRILAGRPS
ncbi:phosphotriesterase [Pseudonocardia sp. C8]|uniref:phosphotriesterase family protein n=1 Tax=Pseudonocardia sp. C8 TaxID=2762759 RepID=UPI001643451D|nr:phosphotriesterase [Pseudonocardia sp. C8]MBC3191101.1 phosphotriesterase [Pseudonocardia sp. C8]